MCTRRGCGVLSPNQKRLTCYRLGVAATLASRDEHDIALAGVDILVLKDEELVDSILLEGSHLDYHADWADQAAIEDDIFLAADLSGSSSVRRSVGTSPEAGERLGLRGTYPLEQMEQVSPRLVPDLIRVEWNSGHHHEHAMGA